MKWDLNFKWQERAAWSVVTGDFILILWILYIHEPAGKRKGGNNNGSYCNARTKDRAIWPRSE